MSKFLTVACALAIVLTLAFTGVSHAQCVGGRCKVGKHTKATAKVTNRGTTVRAHRR